MIQHNPETERFKEQMRNSLQRETRNSRAINGTSSTSAPTFRKAFSTLRKLPEP